ncbi:hypothetical protein [Lactobacillus johnsonii]|uniref:hypothetical protein n=1 Tax=Lactobacillus johnsonii TaxID=33959 RepID=UPI000B987720|nr:hypothetical protein [Lactobacillus johnsonii]OYS05046.1 hypothetical protein CBF54_03295 [Lactobacillus johnsonii]TGA93967.1 hypothetical protein E5F86_04200 [Lactobacillus johnsonii]
MIYFLSENTTTGTNAGNKARMDTETILKKKKYSPIEGPKSIQRLKHGNKISFFLKNSSFLRRLKKIPLNEYLVVQYPFLVSYKNGEGWLDCSFILERLAKRNKLILVIHDIDQLRFESSRNNISDFKLAAYIISHNQKMTNYLINNNIDQNKIINLEIFDYLTSTENSSNHYEDEALLCYAGNLKKSKFIYKFPSELRKSKVNLYGNGYTGNQNGLDYKGAFPSDKINSIIKGKYGLIWDGDRIDTCSGNVGNYLRYNNPHKLSMYLVANMPVIIWDKAAEADFVKKNGLGITINSLNEIPEKINNISKDDYLKMNRAVKDVKSKLEEGKFLLNALNEIESRMKNA